MVAVVPSLLALLAGCGPQATVPRSVQTAAGQTAWGLNGSFRPALTNEQVLTGRVQFVIEPFNKKHGHWVVLLLDDQIVADAEIPACATNVVVFEIDTAKFAAGPHALSLGGEIGFPKGYLTWVTGKMAETELLPERTWKVTFEALVSETAAVPPSNQVSAAKPAENPDPTNAPPVRRRRGNLSNKDLLDKRTEEFRQKSEVAFDKLLAVLKPYGSEPSKVFNTGREIHVQYSTNREGGIKIEVGVRSDSHQASFLAGPVDARGEHINPSLPEGPLLTQFASLYDGSDIRRNPSATNTWHQATGKWSEADAVAETLRLAHALGHQTNRVTRTEFVAVPLHLKNPSGTDVVVTPFYKVDLYNANDSRLLGVEYRIGSEPPGKVTRWFNWPPIKVP